MIFKRFMVVLCCIGLIVLLIPDTRGWFFRYHLRGVYLCGMAFCLAYLLTPLVRRVALRLGVLDIPGGRKNHDAPTPLLGGVAVYGAFATVVLLNFYFSFEMKGVALGGTLIFLLGLIDDVRELPSSFKLFVQCVAVAILIGYGVVISFFPQTTLWGIVLSWGLTAAWVIGITNAVNCLDGLDGLATGMAVMICFFFGLIALRTGQEFMVFLALSLCGSCLGFLPHNFRPGNRATIFLGDAGSTFLGFILAGIGVMGEWGEDHVVGLVVPVLLLGVPIFDMTFTTIMRIKEGVVRGIGEWLAYTGRDHFHHRLLDMGLEKPWATFIIWTVTMLSGLSALLLKNARGVEAVFALAQSATIFTLMAFFMVFVKRQSVENRLTDRQEKENA
ncbi:MAG: undecaprenyl/decaprenyl-phosphate alpha-N-acetylglucosaminyl 1-phosphate transferase [Candidatus Latescibacteria bacterium]|nr:undecaprenyl/decaprenyl-phosphate alpha-N-acetylglucosaminyl 1-phosphate transferase [Candidatus Latescibacterota bacterium]